MKPLELYELWEAFSRLIADQSFSNSARLAMGREVYASLPSQMLCATSKSALDAIKEAMKGRLISLESEIGRAKEGAGDTTPAVQRGEAKAEKPKGNPARAKKSQSQESESGS